MTPEPIFTPTRTELEGWSDGALFNAAAKCSDVTGNEAHCWRCFAFSVWVERDEAKKAGYL